MGFLSSLTNTEDQSSQDSRAAAMEAEFQRRLAAREAAGTIDPERDAQLHDYINNFSNDSEAAAASEGFQEGLAQGLDNVLQFPGKVVGAVGDAASKSVWGIFKNIPWWVYLGAAVAAFFYLGGGVVARRLITKKLA